MSRPKRLPVPTELYLQAYEELRNDIFSYYVELPALLEALNKCCVSAHQKANFSRLIKHLKDIEIAKTSIFKMISDEELLSFATEDEYKAYLTKNLVEGNISMIKIVNIYLAKDIVSSKKQSCEDKAIKNEIKPFFKAFPEIVDVLKNCVASGKADYRPCNDKIAKMCTFLYNKDLSEEQKHTFNAVDINKVKSLVDEFSFENEPKRLEKNIINDNITPDEMQKLLLDNCNNTYKVAEHLTQMLGRKVTHQNINRYCKQHGIDTNGFPFGYVVGNFVIIKRVRTLNKVPIYHCVCRCGNSFEASNAIIHQCIKGGYKYGCKECCPRKEKDLYDQ